MTIIVTSKRYNTRMRIADKPLKTHVTTVRFDSELWKQLENYAASNDMSVAAVIRREVRNLLNRSN